jgi:hypothetical protein
MPVTTSDLLQTAAFRGALAIVLAAARSCSAPPALAAEVVDAKS